MGKDCEVEVWALKQVVSNEHLTAQIIGPSEVGTCEQLLLDGSLSFGWKRSDNVRFLWSIVQPVAEQRQFLTEGNMLTINRIDMTASSYLISLQVEVTRDASLTITSPPVYHFVELTELQYPFKVTSVSTPLAPSHSYGVKVKSILKPIDCQSNITAPAVQNGKDDARLSYTFQWTLQKVTGTSNEHTHGEHIHRDQKTTLEALLEKAEGSLSIPSHLLSPRAVYLFKLSVNQTRIDSAGRKTSSVRSTFAPITVRPSRLVALLSAYSFSVSYEEAFQIDARSSFNPDAWHDRANIAHYQ